MRVWLPPQQHSCRSQTTVTEIQIGRKLQIDENLLSPKQHVSNWQLTHSLLTQSFKSCCRLGKATPTNKYLQQITTMWEQSSEYKKIGPERKKKIYKCYLLVDTDLEGVRTNGPTKCTKCTVDTVHSRHSTTVHSRHCTQYTTKDNSQTCWTSNWDLEQQQGFKMNWC